MVIIPLVFCPPLTEDEYQYSEINGALNVWAGRHLTMTLTPRDIPMLEVWVEKLKAMSPKGSLVDEVV